jgi:putative ABC transport system permease protein
MIRDLRLATRGLLRQPGFSVLAVVILALGLGAATAMFSVVDALFLRALPYADADRLVRLHRTVGADSADKLHSVGAFYEYRAQSAVFEGVAAVHLRDTSLTIEPGQAPDMIWGTVVTADYFDVHKVRPRLGRVFLPEEYQAGRDRVVVLSTQLWQSRFGSDPSIVGRKVQLDGEAFTVVGVMPPELHDPVRFWGRGLLWRPESFWAGAQNDHRGHWLRLVARLRPGVSQASAQAAVSAVAARLDSVHRTGSGVAVSSPHGTGGLDAAGKRVAWLALALALFALLAACLNLAGVQLARLAGRGHELAIRTALGAGRGRLVREMLIESLVLSMAGGLLGMLVAVWCAEMVGSRMTFGMVRVTVGAPVQLDARVLGFGLVMVLATAGVVGFLPAWLGARGAVSQSLRKGGRASTERSWPRLRQALLVTEMALALVLLAAGGLLLRGLHRFADRDPGWAVDGLLTARLAVTSRQDANQRSPVLFDRLHQRLAALPGVETVAFTGNLPLWDAQHDQHFRVQGMPAPRAGHEPVAHLNAATPDYFRTLRVPLREGRMFSAADGPKTLPVAIINETMARQLWPGDSAIGKRIIEAQHNPSDASRWRTIVGVVADVRLAATLSQPSTRFQVHYPAQQASMWNAMVLLRTRAAPESLTADLRRAVAEIDPGLPVYEAHSARALVQRSLANFSVIAWTLFGFAGLGLVLCALGVYGLFSGYVVQRTREIGVRMALGAQAGQVLALVLGKGLRLALLGGAAGVAGASAVAPVLTSLAAELPAHDPVAVLVLAGVLIAVALFACWLPARRAAAMDPMVALRQE